MNKFCLIIIGIVFFSSCRKQDAEVPMVGGTEYYPTDIGSFRIYDVHNITYNGKKFDTTYQVKEVIHDTVHMVSGITYELYRFYRHSSADAWPSQPDSVWRMTKNTYQVTIEEGSIEYIRLAFPFSPNLEWDGNAKNVLAQNTYTLKDIGSPYSYDSKNYPQTCNVQEAQIKNLIQKDYRNRIYAKDIGLVYKKYEVLRYKDDSFFIGKDSIDFGTIVEQKLIGYGKP